ncbi:YesU family protein [Halosquirtibacter xylanolyticus]|uniref:DUF1961 family protein n=1 Tax=Halosquirtibacter xylanolyticus TaxID=3374599 RepID=UPI003749691D|nr:YesU family protein [Prolixibacteraceae bacterium]
MKHIIVVCLLCVMSTLTHAKQREHYKKKLVYSCNFSKQEDLNDWVMEGPGVASIRNGKLILTPSYQKVVADYFSSKGQIFDGRITDYYKPLEDAIESEIGDEVKKYYYEGAFKGGHIVYWNKFHTPDNYILSCDFKSLSPHALHMLMFSCTGIEGQSVFDKKLNPRCGVAAQYTKGDLKNYRISFFAPFRGTSHMRKCPGRILTVKGEDLTLKHPNRTHRLKVVKYKNYIAWYIDNKLCFSFTDETKEGSLGGGQTAIRLMVPAIGSYDNYKIYEIHK